MGVGAGAIVDLDVAVGKAFVLLAGVDTSTGIGVDVSVAFGALAWFLQLAIIRNIKIIISM